MKRIVLSISMVVFTISLYAQQGNLVIPGEEIEAKAPHFNMNKSEKLNISNDWFNFYEEISQLSGGWVSFLDYLFPDSTVQWVGTGGNNFVWKIAQGQVLDPTSQLFIFESKPISKAANYTLDSVAIPYAYRRTQTAKPDTLLIQVIKSDKLFYTPLPNWTTPRSYCRPDYDPIANKGVGAIKEFKVVLTEADTAVNFARVLTQAVDVDVAPDEEIAVTLHYIPGNPYNVGDTLSRTLNGPGIINNFAVYNGRDESKTENNNFYNHNLMITKEIRTNTDANNWNEKYIPGVAWNSGIYHTNIYFNITFDDYTGISNSSLIEHMDVYPNPVQSILNLEYQVNNASRISVEFTDVLGQKVYEEVLPINGSKSTIDVSGWKNGLYIYTVLVDGQIGQTSRIVVSK